MAAVNPQDNSSLDQSIPKWKRELILRRRALSRTLPAGNASVKLTCPSVVTAVKQADQATLVEDVPGKYQRRVPTPPAASKGSVEEVKADFLPTDRGGISSLAFAESPVVVSNMRLVEPHADAGNDLMNGVGMGSSTVAVNSVKFWDRMGEEKLSKHRASNKTMSNSVVLSENNCVEDSDSDSSEELQYGPGIVNRLKDKYMSMTLRENQSRVTRTSFSNMRRAASLENLIDNEDRDIEKQQTKTQHRYTKKSDTPNDSSNKHSAPQHHRYRGITRGNDSMKRARSVETLLRYDNRTISGRSGARDLPSFDRVNKKQATVDSRKSAQFVKSLCKEDIVIVENKSKADASSGVSEDKQHVSKGSTSPKVRSPSVASETECLPPDLVKQALKIFERRPELETTGTKSFSSNTTKTSANVGTSGNFVGAVSKPVLSPKPSPDKISQVSPARPSSPRKTPGNVEQALPPFPQKRGSTPPPSPSRSPNNLTAPLGRLQSPSPTTEIYKLFSMNDSDLESSDISHSVSGDGKVDKSSDSRNAVEAIDGHSRVISPAALENIRKCGMSEKYHFVNNSVADKPKSHLPGVQLAVIPKSKPPVQVPLKPEPSSMQKLSPSVKSTDPLQVQVKQVGIIKPMVTSKSTSNAFHNNREKEKNFKNREKSADQSVIPINKLSDAIARSSDTGKSQVENSASDIFPSRILRETKGPGLWDKKPASNELTYNFVNSKTSIPDYIPNDGIILRKTPVKPKPGESGYIRLSGSSDESSTDADADYLDDSPPSPCNVVFVGGNVLINGRSNMRKENKSRKMHISFNDSATTTFEYPSEASLMGELATPVSGVPTPTGGSSLASYTPSKVVLGTEGFQLGVTRSLPNANQPVTTDQETPQKDETLDTDPHLKPAEDGETMAWSEGNTADLLF
ncbi:uncharacterized protein LOC126470236 [Schistocerca serialis cubense]|uniref:uncharacterized protein LOC126470236 n=1 Tax=Schistocerca serialis cubense TaxID=2023355 RepID=UPI00214F28CF|nr:uncharacterized protein LOC126470236 [Schistocerca serialis cubense]